MPFNVKFRITVCSSAEMAKDIIACLLYFSFFFQTIRISKSQKKKTLFQYIQIAYPFKFTLHWRNCISITCRTQWIRNIGQHYRYKLLFIAISTQTFYNSCIWYEFCYLYFCVSVFFMFWFYNIFISVSFAYLFTLKLIHDFHYEVSTRKTYPGILCVNNLLIA